MAEAIEAFTRAIASGKKTDQRRAEGLINVNKAWVLYESGDLTGARTSIDEAIATFDALESEPDARVAGIFARLSTARSHGTAGAKRHRSGASSPTTI